MLSFMYIAGIRNVLIDNIFSSHLCAIITGSYRFSRSVVFANLVEDVHPSMPDRCKHIGIEHEETMRKDGCLNSYCVPEAIWCPLILEG